MSTQNADNKIIVSTNVYALRDDYSNNTHYTQRGFVGSRNFLANVLVLDSASTFLFNEIPRQEKLTNSVP